MFLGSQILPADPRLQHLHCVPVCTHTQAHTQAFFRKWRTTRWPAAYDIGSKDPGLWAMLQITHGSSLIIILQVDWGNKWGKSGLPSHYPPRVAHGWRPLFLPPAPGFYLPDGVAGLPFCPPPPTPRSRWTDPRQGHTGWLGISIQVPPHSVCGYIYKPCQVVPKGAWKTC